MEGLSYCPSKEAIQYRRGGTGKVIKISGSDVSFAIITGLSGAGKTQSMKALEDWIFSA